MRVRPATGLLFRCGLVGRVDGRGEALVTGRPIGGRAVRMNGRLEERVVGRRLVVDRQREHFGPMVGRRLLVGDRDRVDVAGEKRRDK